ncbi:hypothetical protein DMUE_5680 [Dictyocoela muelleri]|nr:hypothetical protein DMUE_5680 [Dictyocoela muelleri]
MKILTKDNQILEIQEKMVEKCKLFYNLKKHTIINEPVQIQIDSKYINYINEFVETDNEFLIENYDPLKIYFSPEQLEKIGMLDEDFLIDLSATANYLDYPFLLELCCKTIAEKLKYVPINKIKDYLHPLNEVDDKFSWISSDEDNNLL